MSDTRLILHVKGTEAQTEELPREAVKEAISQGKITHSQLIWRPIENAWKPVRELPELLPVERFILHVKGTESETHELSKEEVRTAITHGKITDSQLIWRPAENTWKPVRELPDIFPRQASIPIPAAQPLESVADTVVPATIPHLRINLPASTAQTAFVPPKRATGAPVATIPATATVPRVKATIPQRVASAGPKASTPTPTLVRSTGDLEVKVEEGMHLFKWICLGLGLLILLIVGINYWLVDKPLVAQLETTTYGNITVYAHLGAFVQPNVLVIHIPSNPAITPTNITRYLVKLAYSTPRNPLTHELFTRVALTNSWTAQYSFSGKDWDEISTMTKETDDQREETIMSFLGDAGGQSLLPESTLNEDVVKARSDKVWQTFVSHFTGG